MNTELMRHKSVLFLISLSQNKIQEIENKGVDYQLFMKTIRVFSHVEVRETISEELLSSASLYEVVVIVGHQVNGCIEMADGSLFPMNIIASALPSTFSGYLHVAVCGSSVIFDAIKERCPNSRVRASKRATQLELQLLIYSLLLSRTDLSKDTFDYWYVFERDYIKELQKSKNPAVLAKLPCATKLGEEKDIMTSVFAPKEAETTYTFLIQAFLYFDSEKGNVIAQAKAEGVDPDTKPRLIQEPLTNIQTDDMIDVRLTMLDKNKKPTQNILVFYQEGTFKIPVKIGEKETKVSFDVNITEQYSYEECWAQISFIKPNCVKPCHNLEAFKIKITVPENRAQLLANMERMGQNLETQGIRPEKIAKADTHLEQLRELKALNRKKILERLFELVDKGDWTPYEKIDEVKQMLQTILGQGDVKLNEKELKLSESLWYLLENGRGDRVKITWQNLIGYFDEKKLFRTKGSPALNKDFFDNEDGYTNIDKGRPKETNIYMPRRFYDVIELLDTYCPS